jgi:hypothetical protein
MIANKAQTSIAMLATTHPEFDANTEALLVAQTFSSSIVGKTVLVTGVSPGGIGFTTAQAFVSDVQTKRYGRVFDTNLEAGLAVACSSSDQWSHPLEASGMCRGNEV